MLKKVYLFESDHVELKAHAAINNRKLHTVQREALQRLVETHGDAPSMLSWDAQMTDGPIVRQNWTVDPDTWDAFVRMREQSGLTTRQLLQEAVSLTVNSS